MAIHITSRVNCHRHHQNHQLGSEVEKSCRSCIMSSVCTKLYVNVCVCVCVCVGVHSSPLCHALQLTACTISLFLWSELSVVFIMEEKSHIIGIDIRLYCVSEEAFDITDSNLAFSSLIRHESAIGTMWHSSEHRLALLFLMTICFPFA